MTAFQAVRDAVAQVYKDYPELVETAVFHKVSKTRNSDGTYIAPQSSQQSADVLITTPLSDAVKSDPLPRDATDAGVVSALMLRPSSAVSSYVKLGARVSVRGREFKIIEIREDALQATVAFDMADEVAL